MAIRISRKSIHDVDDVWVYENFMPASFLPILKQYFLSTSAHEKINFEGRSISYNGSNYKLIGTQHYRPYHKLWDLSHTKEYWDQTNDSILAWADNSYREFVHPSVRLLIEKIKTVEPLKGKEWIAMRGLMNVLEPGISLESHIDSNSYIYDAVNKSIYSATFYIDVEDSEGGEFWDERGFMHKPKNNDLLINVGSKYFHGVRASNKFRLGITVRFYEPADLILGSRDSLLYKPEWL
jgi:hypothetical protein